MLFFDYIALHYFVAMALIIPLLKTNKFLNPFICYAFLMATIECLFPFYKQGLPTPLRVSLNNQSSLYLSYLLGFVLLMKSEIYTEKIYKWLSRLGVVVVSCSVLAILFVWGHEGFFWLHRNGYTFKDMELVRMENLGYISGLVPNKSMNAILVLMLFPYLKFLETKKYWLFGILSAFVVLMSKSSTAYLCAFTLMVCEFIDKKQRELISLSAVLFLFAIMILGDGFEGGGRFLMWKTYIGDMSKLELVFGKGPGTFLAWGPYIQSKSAVLQKSIDHGWNIFMHCDLIEALFCYGIVGLVLLIPIVWMIALFAEFSELYSLLMFFVGGLLYYPSHFGIHMIVAALSMKVVENRRKEVVG